MEGRNDDITLEIEGTQIQCRRADLIEHSDYFKAMFEDSFSETVITLNGVEPEAINKILKLLWDRESIIDEAHILSVLQAACMLQFLEIKNLCIERVENMLSVNNCFKIWICAESLGLTTTTLFRKAKLMASFEFKFLKDTSDFLELSLDRILNYLGSIYLHCSSELVVFEAFTKWYENSNEKSVEILLKLLHCLDFNALKVEEINEMLTSLDIIEHKTMTDVLNCVIAIKTDMSDVENVFEKIAVDHAKALLRSRSRNFHGSPCMLLESMDDSTKHALICCDPKYSSLKKLCDVSRKLKCYLNFIGSYKQYLVMYGASSKGRRSELLIFDLITGKWGGGAQSYWSNLVVPFSSFRTKVKISICDKYLYIVRARGSETENFSCFNLEENKWHFINKQLRCSNIHEINCCSFENKFIVLEININCGWIFNHKDESWNAIPIVDRDNVLPSYSENMAMFSYKSSLYIKGNDLFELKAQENTLLVVNKISFPPEPHGFQTYTSLCHNILYSLKRSQETLFLESFNMDTQESAKIFERGVCDGVVEIDNESFQAKKKHLNIGCVFHYDLVAENDRINCS